MATASLKPPHLPRPSRSNEPTHSSSPAIPGTSIIATTLPHHPSNPRHQITHAGRLCCCAAVRGSHGRGSGRGGGGNGGTAGGTGGLDGYEDLARYGLDDFEFSPMFMPPSPTAAPFLPPFPEQLPPSTFSTSTASAPAQSPPVPATSPPFPLDQPLASPPAQNPFTSSAPGQVAGAPDSAGSPGIDIGLGAFPGLDFGGLGIRRGRERGKSGGEEGLGQQLEGLWGGRAEGARKEGVRGRRGAQGAGSRGGKTSAAGAGAAGGKGGLAGAGAGAGAGTGAASAAAFAAGGLSSSEEEEEGSGTWSVYLLLSADCRKTYVGVTMDVQRRVKQHNGEVVGGAKSTRAGRPWTLVGAVEGFRTRSEAFQFEWRWKNPRTIRGDGSYDRSAVSAVPAATDRFGNPEPLVLLRRRSALEEARKSFPDWNHLTFTWNENTVHAPAPAAADAGAAPASAAAAAAAAAASDDATDAGGLAGTGSPQLA
ncbi:unnamed protein product [Closterium sp. Yama58-4]|nr:unnamed protein product [Closterium sp. Yama58-4]